LFNQFVIVIFQHQKEIIFGSSLEIY